MNGSYEDEQIDERLNRCRHALIARNAMLKYARERGCAELVAGMLKESEPVVTRLMDALVGLVNSARRGRVVASSIPANDNALVPAGGPA